MNQVLSQHSGDSERKKPLDSLKDGMADCLALCLTCEVVLFITFFYETVMHLHSFLPLFVEDFFSTLQRPLQVCLGTCQVNKNLVNKLYSCKFVKCNLQLSS